MASEENQTLSCDAISSLQLSGSRTCREARHANGSQAVRQYLSSHDSWKETTLNEEYRCLKYSSQLCTEDKHTECPQLSIGKRSRSRTNPVTPIPGRGLEGSPCQLNITGEGVDAGSNTAGSTCSCTLSNLYMSPNGYCCHSPASSPKLSSSSTTSHCKKQHIRHSSLPLSMLTFHKVIKVVVHLAAASTLWHECLCF